MVKLMMKERTTFTPEMAREMRRLACPCLKTLRESLTITPTVTRTWKEEWKWKRKGGRDGWMNG